MANKQLFQTFRGPRAAKPDAINEAGGLAYQRAPKELLAQLAITGCLNGVYYVSARSQLDELLAACENAEASFIAKVAVYARKYGFMKDTPAVLLAVLSTRDSALFRETFASVIDNARMLRNFVQVMRSGLVGRKSLGSAPKQMVRQWIVERDAEALFRDSVGQSPSLADVIRMVHPRPRNHEQAALFAYLTGSPGKRDQLPALVKRYIAFKDGKSNKVPDVPFQLLTALSLRQQDWKEVAMNGRWQMTRMNLSTFARHGLFESSKLTSVVARRLADPDLVRRAKAFPYQLMVAAMQVQQQVPEQVPARIREALENAMQVALENVPRIEGRIIIAIDVSGSMRSPATGWRKGSTSAVRCVDVAALFACAIVARNAQTEVLAFDTDVYRFYAGGKAGVIEAAARLARYGGGGTNCGLPLAKLNKQRARADLVIYFSDNQSWADQGSSHFGSDRGTSMMSEWIRFKTRNQDARLALIDLQPYATSQVQTRPDVLQIGGFSDQVFKVLGAFAQSDGSSQYWTHLIEGHVH